MNRAERRRQQKGSRKDRTRRAPKPSQSAVALEGTPALDQLNLVERVHEHADIPAHVDILHAADKIGDLSFLELFRDCLDRSGTTTAPWKTLRRIERARNLAHYFHHSLSVGGQAVECGVYKGFSALMMARIWQAQDLGFSGQGLHIVDSFAGLSPPVEGDVIDTGDPDGGVLSHQAGHFAVPLEHVQSVLAGYPEIMVYKGWIPGALDSLPDQAWSFVHIDVDLYEPTKAAVEYFLPRLMPGAVMINDDFSSPLFPGGGIGWREAMGDRPYAVLDSGQAVYIHKG